MNKPKTLKLLESVKTPSEKKLEAARDLLGFESPEYWARRNLGNIPTPELAGLLKAAKIDAQFSHASRCNWIYLTLVGRVEDSNELRKSLRKELRDSRKILSLLQIERDRRVAFLSLELRLLRGA